MVSVVDLNLADRTAAVMAHNLAVWAPRQCSFAHVHGGAAIPFEGAAVTTVVGSTRTGTDDDVT